MQPRKLCFYCEEPAGLEGLTAYEAGGVVEHLHPSCFVSMKDHGSCSGDEEDDAAFQPRALSPGGDA
jgi:hypothetical protein